MAKRQNVIRIYACGGAATNIASKLEEARQGTPASAAMDLAYIDTSDSNQRRPQIPATSTYHLLDENGKLLDGAGQQRRDILPAVLANMPDIMNQFKPASFNIVLFSAAGGSGSVIGPAIMKHLLNDNVPAVGIVIGSDASKTYAENTLKTIKTLDAIADSIGRPIIIAYTQNTAERARQMNDEWAYRYILGLAVLFSGLNHELDSRDLHNFLRIDVAAPAYAQRRLISLTLLQGNARLDEKYTGPITVASLARSVETIEAQRFATTPKYHVSGILPDVSGQDDFLSHDPYHYVTSIGFIENIVNDLTAANRRIDDEDDVAISQPAISSLADRRTNDVWIL